MEGIAELARRCDMELDERAEVSKEGRSRVVVEPDGIATEIVEGV
jgi:hypothetical protein